MSQNRRNLWHNLQRFYKKNKLVAALTLIVSAVFILSTVFATYLIVSDNGISTASANEPTNCNSPAGATPTYNPYPTRTNTPNVDPTTCSDMPQLSFFPVNTTQGNPREFNATTTFSIQLTYMNGANPNSPSIASPNARVFVDQVSPTRFRISSQLAGGNTATLTSQQDGGDLFVNVPTGSRLQIIQNQTTHFPDAIERRAEATTTGRSPNDDIQDNGANSNPLFARFAGTNLASDQGFNFKPQGLEAGFLGYGYILSQIAVIAPQNTPPIINGSEITIIRGQGGQFPVTVQPRDAEDRPDQIRVTANNYPSWVTPPASDLRDNVTIRVPTTDANTPARTVFTLTPTDSGGLVGNPGTWIINVIDPGMNLVKSCFVKATNQPCGTQRPGDVVIYRINLRNSGQVNLTGVVLTDDYEEAKIEDITAITPPANAHNTQTGVLTWNIGNLNIGQEFNASFEATVRRSLTQNTTVRNIARATSNETGQRESIVDFNVVVPVNTPPTINGSEVTIIRGQGGAFPVTVQPRDAEDRPDQIRVTSPNYPNFVTPPSTEIRDGVTITIPRTDSNTPARTVFTLVPTDSQGLQGNPGTWIINVIDPGLNLIKSCIVKTTNQPCATQRPGDLVVYRLDLRNTGQVDLTGVTVTDDYDQTKLTNISAITPAATSVDNAQGVIVWNIGNLPRTQTRQFSFEATVANGVANTTIDNIAIARSNETPESRSNAVFEVPGNPQLAITKVCVTVSAGSNCAQSQLRPGDKVRYNLEVRNNGNTPARNVRVVDDYDQTRIGQITALNPDNGAVNTENGTITWGLGDLNAGGSVRLSYEATILTQVRNGDVVINIATATAEGLPPVSAQANFPITLPQIVTPRTGGIAILGTWGAILLGGFGAYKVNEQRNKKVGSKFVPARSREE